MGAGIKPILALLEQLAAAHPVFVELWEPHRPLKVGIAKDLVACHPDIIPRALGHVLGYYTRRRMYLVGLLEPGAWRHDLDGNPVEPVSDAARAHARERLARLDELEQRRVAEAKARIAAIRAVRETPTVAVVELPRPVRRLSLSDLKASAQLRRGATGA
jgi:sRNA-binding protein